VKLKHYCVKVVTHFFPPKKHTKAFIPTNIKLNGPINLFLNELKEQLVSPCLAFVQIWQLQGYGQYNIKIL
jgi:hypothetical protein